MDELIEYNSVSGHLLAVRTPNILQRMRGSSPLVFWESPVSILWCKTLCWIIRTVYLSVDIKFFQWQFAKIQFLQANFSLTIEQKCKYLQSCTLTDLVIGHGALNLDRFFRIKNSKIMHTDNSKNEPNCVNYPQLRNFLKYLWNRAKMPIFSALAKVAVLGVCARGARNFKAFNLKIPSESKLKWWPRGRWRASDLTP